MRKPNIIQVTAGTTLLLSMGANAWYGIDQWSRGGAALIVAGVWMPVAIVLLERVMHSAKLGKWFGAGIALVALACMYYSMSHLAHLATPVDPSGKEVADGWIFAGSVDVVMVLSGIALVAASKTKPALAPAPEVVEKIVTVDVPIEVEKIVYVEAPSQVQAEETETVTETVTRTATRTRRSGWDPELRERAVELITTTDLKPIEIMRKLAIEGHPNKITRLPEWATHRQS